MHNLGGTPGARKSFFAVQHSHAQMTWKLFPQSFANEASEAVSRIPRAATQ